MVVKDGFGAERLDKLEVLGRASRDRSEAGPVSLLVRPLPNIGEGGMPFEDLNNHGSH